LSPSKSTNPAGGRGADASTGRAAGVSVVAGMLMLSACTSIGPDYERPALEAPAAWHRSGQSARPDKLADLAQWWSQLDDPILSELIGRALLVNPDVRTAGARLREARARNAFARASLSPTVSASASYSQARGSAETGAGDTLERYRAALDPSWEADLFGARRRGVEAAKADAESSAAALAAARVALAAELALNYVEVRALQARLEVAHRNLETQAQTWQLTDWRAQAGLASALESEQARAALEQTRALIPSLEADLAAAKDQIAVLLATTPGALARMLDEPRAIPAAREQVALGIPADVLRQRPDVRAAERHLAAETARVGQASAARYPDLTLSGSIGLDVFRLRALGNSGALAGSFIAGISGVLFDGGRLGHQVEIQDAVREQALIAYEAAVISAIQEVETALAALHQSGLRQKVLRTAVDAARNAASYALLRYSGGVVDFLAVLDTQRTVLSVEDALAAAQANSTAALIRLYKALGGGWKPGSAEGDRDKAS
jgi:NodT family efflux transporter outer membrane factor (OMF) lipoprotein